MLKFHHIYYILLCLASVPVYASGEDSLSTRDRLWQQIAIDTLPHRITHDNIERIAHSATILLTLNGEGDTLGLRNTYAQAYYYNLLANNNLALDFLESNVQEQFPYIVGELNGHFGLRRYLACKDIPSDSCAAIRKWGLQFFEKAAVTSNIMPKEQWKWIVSNIKNELPYSSFQESVTLDTSHYTVLSNKNWEGSIIGFRRLPGIQNLLISNGTRDSIIVLEWSGKANSWTDVTEAAGLNNYPGGHRIYIVDYNNDGLDDILILRQSSVVASPAKLFPSLLQNDGKGSYTDVTATTGLDKVNRPNCACWDDINGDGRPDVFIGSYRENAVWLVQDSTGRFTNMANAYNISTAKENITDCAILDLNGDGKKDLLLSNYKGKNKAYIQELVDNKYIIFRDQAREMGLQTPTLSGAILTDDYNHDGRQDALFLSDVSERFDIIAQILTQQDTVIADTSLLLHTSDKGLQSTLLPKELAFYRTGIAVNTLEGTRLIYGGGKTTESLLPLFEYTLGDEKVSIANIPGLPLYPHSITTVETGGQPHFLIKGGGDYPVMRDHVSSFSYQPEAGGKFHRIFNLQQWKTGDVIRYTIHNKDGVVSERSVTVQARDSKGNHALQEWIWLPEGYHITLLSEISKKQTEHLPASSPKEKKKKKTKKPKNKGTSVSE